MRVLRKHTVREQSSETAMVFIAFFFSTFRPATFFHHGVIAKHGEYLYEKFLIFFLLGAITTDPITRTRTYFILRERAELFSNRTRKLRGPGPFECTRIVTTRTYVFFERFYYFRLVLITPLILVFWRRTIAQFVS